MSLILSFLCLQGDPLINVRSKEQEAELVNQTLAALTAMRIRFPGKSEEEAESVLDEVRGIMLPSSEVVVMDKKGSGMQADTTPNGTLACMGSFTIF